MAWPACPPPPTARTSTCRPDPAKYLLWPADTRFARQYVRRVCARLHGLAGQYDWRDHPFGHNQRLTADILRGTFDQQAA